ncbi:hypothetical protein [Bradyrhizobium sp. UFLA05-112]
MNRPFDLAGFVNAAPLPRRRGQRTEAALAALEERDRLIQCAAATFCAGMSARSAARTLHAALARYRELGWRRDRAEVQCPARHVGTITEACWLILKQRDFAVSARAIRRMLTA